MRIRIWGPLAVAALMLAPTLTHAACDCQDKNGDGYPEVGGSCTEKAPTTLTYVSGVNGGLPSDSISITVGDSDGDGKITCGMYASGDFWIVGEGSPKRVRVTATAPSQSNGGNGWMINPGLNGNGLDSGIGSYVAPAALPRDFATGSGVISFIKAKSATVKDEANKPYPCAGQDSRSCIQFAGVYTFVDSAPNNSHDLFRPQYAGPSSTKWTNLRVSQMAPRVAVFPSLKPPAQGSGPALASVAKRGRWPGIGYHTNQKQRDVQHWMARQNWGERFCKQGSGYGLNIGCSDASAVIRFFLNDFDRSLPMGSVSRNALLSIVQKGIDALGGIKVGGAWGPPLSQQTSNNSWGNIFDGRILMPYFAAYMTGDSQLRALFRERRQAGAFFLGRYFDHGPASAPYQGFTKTESPTCRNLANNCSVSPSAESGYCLPAAADRDANCCKADKSYPHWSAVLATNTSMAILLMDKSAAGVDDPSAAFNYDRMLSFSLGYGPGATSRRGVVQGAVCSGSGGQIANGFYFDQNGTSEFLKGMWTTYVDSFSQARLGGATPGDDRPAPPILIDVK